MKERELSIIYRLLRKWRSLMPVEGQFLVLGAVRTAVTKRFRLLLDHTRLAGTATVAEVLLQK